MLKLKRFYKIRKSARPFIRDLYKLSLFFFSFKNIRSRRRSSSKDQRKHLAVLRPDGIGDFVIFARNMHRLRNLYPAPIWKITLIGNNVWRSLAEALNQQNASHCFDAYIGIDRMKIRNEPGYRKWLVDSLKSLYFDELIYPVHSRDMWGSLMAYWIDAATKIAPYGDTDNLCGMFKKRFDRSFSRLIAEKHTIKLEHERSDYFLRQLGDQSPPEETFIHFQLSSAMLKKKALLFQKNKIKDDLNYFVLFPGAAWAKKRWHKECFVSWGKRHVENSDDYILVCGGKDEMALGEWVAHRIGKKAINLAGQTSLVALAALLGTAKGCIANDTAAVHISAAFNRTTTCVLGGGHWGRFWAYGDFKKNRTLCNKMPCFGCGWECKYVGNPAPCIKSIPCNAG
jgi:ADP-heptose:LPS heptosyltransferase